MSTRFRPYHPEQTYLLPPSPSDWLPEGHLAYFIAEIVDTLDVESFYARYEGDGRRNSPYDPRMLLKVLAYAYASGVFSSRKIAKKLEEDVAFRVLGAGNFPDHRTVNRFRQEHLEEFAGIFQQVVKLAREMKLLHMGTLAIDGTKVRANASKHKAMSYGRMKEEEAKLKEEIAELLRRAQAVDEAEDEQYGAERRGDELPEELQRREERLKKIQEAKQRLEERQKEEDRAAGRHENDGGWASGVRPQGGRSRHHREFGEVSEKKQDNFTDPESRIMKTQDGFQQCYNGQIAVASITRFITTQLKLRVNQQKSAVARPWERKFLGFSFTWHREPQRRIAPKAILRFKERIRELTRRTRGVSVEQMAEDLSRYLRGWQGYFGFCQTPYVLRDLEYWLRRRLRAFLWKQWKRGTVRFAELTQRGVSRDLAARTAGSAHGPWRLAESPGRHFALPAAYFASLGIPQLFGPQ